MHVSLLYLDRTAAERTGQTKENINLMCYTIYIKTLYCKTRSVRFLSGLKLMVLLRSSKLSSAVSNYYLKRALFVMQKILSGLAYALKRVGVTVVSSTVTVVYSRR